MIIKVLVENTTISDEFKNIHGLSFYIETKKHKILFDLGPDDTFLKNAEKLQVHIKDIDIVVISHGHSDHGGALKIFLEHNNKAIIYAHKNAFDPYFTKVLFTKIYVGLENNLKTNERIVFVDDQYKIDDELFVFSNVVGRKLFPSNNKPLLMKKDDKFMQDEFAHEQNLIINENGKNVLLEGCAHNGIINIIEKAIQYTGSLDVVIGGFHMFNPATKQTENSELVIELANELNKYDFKYYTCHCTGLKAYDTLKTVLNEKLGYLSSGACLDII